MKGKVEGFLDPVKEAVQKTESVEAGKERPSESQEQSEKKVVNEKKIENGPKPVIAVEPPKVVAAISNESKPKLTESPSNGEIKETEKVEEKEMEIILVGLSFSSSERYIAEWKSEPLCLD